MSKRPQSIKAPAGVHYVKTVPTFLRKDDKNACTGGLKRAIEENLWGVENPLFGNCENLAYAELLLRELRRRVEAAQRGYARRWKRSAQAGNKLLRG